MSDTETPARAAQLPRPTAAHFLAWRPTSPCLLRLVTGIPCPMCGMTTAATSLAAGELQAALAANPFVLLLAGATLVMTVLMAARAVGLAPPAARWQPARQRHVWLVVGVLGIASWLFQLHRFDWI